LEPVVLLAVGLFDGLADGLGLSEGDPDGDAEVLPPVVVEAPPGSRVV
jgi:hypothetical protein